MGMLLLTACNPFAPEFDPDGLSDQNVLGDRTKIDGFFDFFKNAYELRDTSLYGRLFTSDFVFAYYDFDAAAEQQWDKGQEMAIAYNLFRNVRQITLDWNFYVENNVVGDTANVVRSFNLTIVENESTVYSGTGRARLRLRRAADGEPWRIYYSVMETGKSHFEETKRRLWLFFSVLIVFWIVSLYWWLTMGYHGTFVWLNQFRSTPLNYSSLYFFTNLGDGIILPALILIFFWRKDPALAITFVLAFIFTGAIGQMGKRFLFEEWTRPPFVFRLDHTVEIFEPNPPVEHSFPSGHATSFATGGVFFAWGMYEWKKWVPALLGLFTVFLCFTRVFLGVHFPADIFVGSMIGSIGALLVLLFAYPTIHNRLYKWQRKSDPKLGWAIIGFSALLIVGGFIRIALKY
jgi:membrane-associated phospholipid phosphatase